MTLFLFLNLSQNLKSFESLSNKKIHKSEISHITNGGI